MAERQSRTLRLPAEMWAALEAEAKRESRSVNNLIQVMLDEAIIKRLWKDNDTRCRHCAKPRTEHVATVVGGRDDVCPTPAKIVVGKRRGETTWEHTFWEPE